MNHDEDLHIEEFKIRLRPRDARLVRALAGKLDIPPAVLMRRWVRKAIEPHDESASVAEPGEKRSPA